MSKFKVKNFLKEEKVTRNFAFASVVSTKNINKGEILNRNNLWVKRPATGDFKASEFYNLLGKRAKKFIVANRQLKKKMSVKKIIFITGTRADYGKIKNLIKTLSAQKKFEVHIFVTGMHLLKKYGFTKNIIIKENKKKSKIFLFKNQSYEDKLDIILSNTINGFSKFLKKIKPDMVFIHGDRVETLAAAISSSFNNFLTCHIEGGELTGTIDEHIRHSVTKLSHIHFVSNNSAKENLLRMGENPKNVFIVGSPEVDLMKSKLPSIQEVKKRYQISFKNYFILIFHPVTTDLKSLKKDTNLIINTLDKSNNKTIVILPNNDPGSHLILKVYEKNKKNKNFKFIDSMRFEYFLTLLKNAELIIGNSSSGVREAPYYGPQL